MTTEPAVDTARTVVVTREELFSVMVAALVRGGARRSDAVLQALALAEGELRGHPSHGLRRLPTIIERMKRGLIDVEASPEHTWSAAASLNVDGRLGFGPVALNSAIEATLERAEHTGIAMAAISRSSHIGMLAPYVERVAHEGCIGLLLTTSEALVHAWGGRSKIVGTNPIGVGVPTQAEPIVLDMSTSAVSMGKIIDYAARGQPLPHGWAIDRYGNSTSDATAAADSGSISPFGGPKGYALALAIEVLVATVTRTAYGSDVLGTLDSEHPVTKGDLLIVISLDALGLKSTLPLLQSYLEEVRGSSGTADAVDIPGDRARRVREERIAGGVPIDTTVWTNASRLAER